MEQTVTVVVAVFASIIGVGTFFHYFLMVQSWPTASGRVIGNEAQANSNEGATTYSYFPKVEFYALDGQRYEIRGDVGRSSEWPIGKVLKVRYKTSNPNHTSTAHDWQRLLFSLVFLGFASAIWYVILR